MGLLKTVCYKYFNYKKQIPTLSGMENIWLRLSLIFFLRPQPLQNLK